MKYHLVQKRHFWHSYDQVLLSYFLQSFQDKKHSVTHGGECKCLGLPTPIHTLLISMFSSLYLSIQDHTLVSGSYGSGVEFGLELKIKFSKNGVVIGSETCINSLNNRNFFKRYCYSRVTSPYLHHHKAVHESHLETDKNYPPATHLTIVYCAYSFSTNSESYKMFKPRLPML